MSDDHNAGGRRLGPHKVPRIACGNCGTKHHYDAAHGEYLGQCRECGAFLRRPTDAEHRQFTEFLEWNTLHRERERDDGPKKLLADGGRSEAVIDNE